MLALTLALCTAPSIVRVAVFDQPVEVSLDLPGFEANDRGKAPRAILFGSIAGGATISILCEDNDPFLSGADCAGRWKSATNFRVGNVECVESIEKLPAARYATARWHAYVTNADYLYDIHVSATGKDAKFTRKEFGAIVASFETKGRPRTEGRRYPDAYYAFRDEAATHPKDQLEWVRTRCKERAEDALARFYYARLLNQRRDDDAAAAEFVAAADLLEKHAERSDGETTVLMEALDSAAAFHGGRKAWREAIPLCERIVAATENGTSERRIKFRSSALYHLAIAHAQMKQKKPALECLRRAIELDVELKKQAPRDALLAPLHADAGFKKLTGG